MKKQKEKEGVGKMNWNEFKIKNKIKSSNDYTNLNDDELWLDKNMEKIHKKEYERKVNSLKEKGIIEFCFGYLTNEEAEYVGCFLETITINGLTFSATLFRANEEERDYAELIVNGKFVLEEKK